MMRLLKVFVGISFVVAVSTLFMWGVFDNSSPHSSMKIAKLVAPQIEPEHG
ncbi:hypothetical protein [Thermoactinomyces sp. DSM 45892]|uniref:hypothetical protein n=1 Tax=Thermoactinomyces sp. DSM 45892 TaxID=1882753 RepID=UPI0008997777|nr:hypothetical protein [Thermoactinomyces sp. DSM 45892]SDZ25063.1 hypothetical protein SAMN05444416_11780 [Thermoactinomyces sp. DSM 45892]